MTSDEEATAGTFVRGGTSERRSEEQRTARFALLLVAGQDPASVRGRLLAELSPLRATVAPLSSLDQPGFDWDRHGAELAAALLDRQLGVRGLRPGAPPGAVVSPQLAADVTNPDLRAALRLDEPVPAEVKS